jgi:hypothetical protein
MQYSGSSDAPMDSCWLLCAPPDRQHSCMKFLGPTCSLSPDTPDMTFLWVTCWPPPSAFLPALPWHWPCCCLYMARFENDQLDVFPTTTHNTARSRCVADIGLALLVHFTNCAGPASIAHGGHLPARGTIADVCASLTYSFLARSWASVPSILHEKRAPPRDAMVRDALRRRCSYPSARRLSATHAAVRPRFAPSPRRCAAQSKSSSMVTDDLAASRLPEFSVPLLFLSSSPRLLRK